jgi:hypothetical protein
LPISNRGFCRPDWKIVDLDPKVSLLRLQSGFYLDERRSGTFKAFPKSFFVASMPSLPLAISGRAVEHVGRIEIIHFPALPELRVCVGSQS